MEDMHQIVDFEEQPAAAAVGMTHFFAVFDGHGAARAAAWAHAHLVPNLLQELSSAATGGKSATGGSPGSAAASAMPAESASDILDGAAVDAFHRTDSTFLRQAAARGIPDGSTAVTCMIQCPDAASADSANGGGGGTGGSSSSGGGGRSGSGSQSGERRLLVANLGDSRCVMVRKDGSALALSSDHKPNRPDERARVHAAGGHVRAPPTLLRRTALLTALLTASLTAFTSESPQWTQPLLLRPSSFAMRIRPAALSSPLPMPSPCPPPPPPPPALRFLPLPSPPALAAQVIYAGCWRVQGDLAVSRAFGDAHLKPYGVSATPELSAIGLTSTDAFLVLASDGLWDVVDEQQCASSVLRASDPLGAARSLCDLASTRGSMDNITVLVVAL